MSSPYGSLPSVTGEFQDVPFVYRQICDELPQPVSRVADETDGLWFEFGFTAPEELVGNAETGWTDQAGEISWKIEASNDLLEWVDDEMVDCAVTAIDNMDGTFTYWSRRVVPLVWREVMVDMTVGSDRYGKSITAIELFRTAVSLPNYPYAMPSQASQLQTDLRAAGFTDATVTTTTGTLRVGIRNHISSGTNGLMVTMSGANVTAVAPYRGSTISLPSYPYAMPSAQATLQTDLRANGYGGAVVMLYKDEWEIFIPDLDAEFRTRDITLTISPGDPFPVYDFYGSYQGLNSAAAVAGEPSNTRSRDGEPYRESPKAFFRVKRTSIPI